MNSIKYKDLPVEVQARIWEIKKKSDWVGNMISIDQEEEHRYFVEELTNKYGLEDPEVVYDGYDRAELKRAKLRLSNELFEMAAINPDNKFWLLKDLWAMGWVDSCITFYRDVVDEWNTYFLPDDVAEGDIIGTGQLRDARILDMQEHLEDLVDTFIAHITALMHDEIHAHNKAMAKMASYWYDDKHIHEYLLDNDYEDYIVVEEEGGALYGTIAAITFIKK
jgi:hypothetical protein